MSGLGPQALTEALLRNCKAELREFMADRRDRRWLEVLVPEQPDEACCSATSRTCCFVTLHVHTWCWGGRWGGRREPALVLPNGWAFLESGRVAAPDG